MLIRKQFEFNGMHIVRNCSSERCKYSLHAHTYTVELFFTSTKLDNGHMIYDFGLMKGNIKDIIKSFDNSYSLWDKESDDFKNFINDNFDRIVTMPVSPSAEQYSLMIFYLVDKILKATKFNNKEGKIKIHSVKVHETQTGYAQAFKKDLKLIKYNLSNIIFSPSIVNNWSNINMYKNLLNYKNSNKKIFINKKIKKQIK